MFEGENGPKLQVRETFNAASKNEVACYSQNFRGEWQIMIELGKEFGHAAAVYPAQNRVTAKKANSQSYCRAATCIQERYSSELTLGSRLHASVCFASHSAHKESWSSICL